MEKNAASAVNNTGESMLVIIHGGCPDGNAAAHMFKLAGYKFDIYSVFDRVWGRNHNMPKTAGVHVFICDISFSPGVLSAISRSAASLHVWEHHVTTLRELTYSPEGVSRVSLKYVGEHPQCKVIAGCPFEFVYSSDHCAAEVAAIQLGVNQPWYLKHIRDRDLYEWKHQYSREFGEALYDAQICEETFCKLDRFTPDEQLAFYNAGAAIVKHNARIVATICRSAEKVTLNGIPTLVVNSTTLQSEIGNTLVSANPGYIAAIIRYSFKRQTYDISLRSDNSCKNPIDVSSIAAKYGGGGHPAAAGFEYAGPIGELFVKVV